jgi:hypothetical protein
VYVQIQASFFPRYTGLGISFFTGSRLKYDFEIHTVDTRPTASLRVARGVSGGVGRGVCPGGALLRLRRPQRCYAAEVLPARIQLPVQPVRYAGSKVSVIGNLKHQENLARRIFTRVKSKQVHDSPPLIKPVAGCGG